MTKFVHTVTDLGVENEYPKLVRDKIPEIIKREDGREVEVAVLMIQILRQDCDKKP